MFDDLTDLYQQVIIDHSRSPRNFRRLEGATYESQGHNPLCGDQVTLYLLVEDGVVKDISFQGSGCAISKASASLLTTSLKGKSVDEVRSIFAKVRAMVTTGAIETGELGKLSVFAGVHKFPARVKCAILPWHALVAALDGKGDPISTE